jgi:hypothetical protein
MVYRVVPALLTPLPTAPIGLYPKAASTLAMILSSC